MPEQRLIIQKRPRYHKHRLLAAVLVAGLAVAGVWGWQMKSTFARFSDERQANDTNDALSQARANLRSDTDTAAIRENADTLKDILTEIAREEVVKQEVLDQISEDMQAKITTDGSEGVVAGEATEAN